MYDSHQKICTQINRHKTGWIITGILIIQINASHFGVVANIDARFQVGISPVRPIFSPVERKEICVLSLKMERRNFSLSEIPTIHHVTYSLSLSLSLQGVSFYLSLSWNKNTFFSEGGIHNFTQMERELKNLSTYIWWPTSVYSSHRRVMMSTVCSLK